MVVGLKIRIFKRDIVLSSWAAIDQLHEIYMYLLILIFFSIASEASLVIFSYTFSLSGICILYTTVDSLSKLFRAPPASFMSRLI